MNREQEEKILQISYDILKLSRNTLLVHLRFLDIALSVLKPMAAEDISFGTDGTYLYFAPMDILERYKEEKEGVSRAYLHAIMHCIFRHMYVTQTMDREIWDLSCDIAVENLINDLDLKDVTIQRQEKQKAYLKTITGEVKFLTAEKLFRYFSEHRPSEKELLQLKKLFCSDDHFIWYLPSEDQLSGDDKSRNLQGQNSNGRSHSPSSTNAASAKTEWTKISERMLVDMETFVKLKGDEAGGLLQNLREVNREKYDYAEFLRKFAVRGEVMKTNDDEFDYIFYAHGLNLYKNLPLIEPLEYKDVKRIKEFVIAIDTSGSVEGEQVQAFIQKTYNIMKSVESFFSKINLHIIQCDSEVQETVKITSQDEFDYYLKNMKIKGLGGTDFRPTFQYVDELIRKKEFFNLKGMIYFTDGYGEFPAKKPDYDVAFVFVEDQYIIPEVPPWAIKIVLQREEI